MGYAEGIAGDIVALGMDSRRTEAMDRTLECNILLVAVDSR